ncbi:ATP-binding protein, partial [Patescibacteria group bacterium]|nr:ATP-binding protein [Patescibacteria group bacterium]
KEFLDYHKFNLKNFYTTKEKSQLKKYFSKYLEYGGFPEVVKSQDKNELTQLYQDILIKDLIVRFKIKDTRSFRELALYLLSNTASLISFNNLKKILEFKSASSVKNYIDFLEESYLNFSIAKYDYSLKKQIINDKKIFSIDTGLIRAVSFAFSENYGQLLENIVFLELKRRGQEIYYYSDKKECDFLIKQGQKITEAIQVTKTLLPKNKDREINGLLGAMEKYNLKQGLILTDDLEDELKIDNKKIIIKPVYEWLLEN